MSILQHKRRRKDLGNKWFRRLLSLPALNERIYGSRFWYRMFGWYECIREECMNRISPTAPLILISQQQQSDAGHEMFESIPISGCVRRKRVLQPPSVCSFVWQGLIPQSWDFSLLHALNFMGWYFAILHFKFFSNSLKCIWQGRENVYVPLASHIASEWMLNICTEVSGCGTTDE